jgi:hypothetical protein
MRNPISYQLKIKQRLATSSKMYSRRAVVPMHGGKKLKLAPNNVKQEVKLFLCTFSHD